VAETKMKLTGQIIGLDKAMSKVISLSKQTKFATAQALNDTAKDVQTFTVTKQLPDKFTLRSRGAPWFRPGTKFGFNIKHANKANLLAVIGSQADWLPDQEKGGIRKARNGRIAVPTLQWKPKKDIMIRSKKPRVILRARAVAGLVAKPFVLGQSVFARTSTAHKPLVKLFTFTPNARIKPVLKYGLGGMAEARRVYPSHFSKRLTFAILTAK
jgi:hypothetical protein